MIVIVNFRVVVTSLSDGLEESSISLSHDVELSLVAEKVFHIISPMSI